APSEVDVEALRHENEQLKKKVDELQSQLDELNSSKKDGVVDPSVAADTLVATSTNEEVKA
ncbi:hypothetical protein HK099_002235, partial [Clydaea vesicula]